MNGTTMNAASVSLRQFIVAVGVVFAAAGVLGLVLPVSANAPLLYGVESVDCGSASSPGGDLGAMGLAECDEALSDRRLWSIPLLALGLIGGIGGVIVRRETGAERDDSA